MAQREVVEIKQTWEHVAKEIKEMEECKKMEESLQEDFPIDELDLGLDVVRRGNSLHGAGEEIFSGDGSEDIVANGEVHLERSGKEDLEGC